MNLIFEQALMYKNLQIVHKAVPSRTPLSILKGICLKLVGDQLYLTTTDLELGIRTLVPVQGIEDGSLVLPERFVEIVRNLPPGQVSMEVHQNMATIKKEDIVFQLHGFPAEEFPVFPEKGEDGEDFVVAGFLLNGMLQKALVTVSSDHSKPAFTGVNFQMEDDTLTLTSSDTFRLSVVREKIRGMAAGEREFIVPAKSLREMTRVVKDDDLVGMNVSRGLAIFSFSDTTLTTSLLAERFPNVSRVIPQDAFTRVKVNKNSLELSLGRAFLLADSDVYTVTLDVGPNQIHLTSSSALGTNDEIIPLLAFEGEEVSLIMNIRFLQDVVKVIPGGEISMRFKGKTGPCIVEPLQDLEYLYLALPVKPD